VSPLTHATTAFTPPPYPGPRVHPRRRPLADVGDAFLADCRARNLSPRTIEQYEWSIHRFGQSLEPHPSLADLEPVAARAWIESLKDTRAPTSVRTAVSALKVFAAWTVTEGYLRADPLATVRLPRAPRPLIQPLSGSQVAALMRVGSAILRVAVAILADTGVRASELCGLTVDDVREGFLFVAGKGGHERLAPYGEACRAELSAYVNKGRGLPRAGNEPLLLTATGVALTPHRLGELMRYAGRAADLRGVRVSPHTLRHTFAIEFLRNGGGELALQKALGHRSLDMVKIYAELTEVDLAHAHRAASPLDAWQLPAQRAQPNGRRPILCSSRSRGDRRSW
jgi:integrase/recombinase XerD